MIIPGRSIGRLKIERRDEILYVVTTRVRGCAYQVSTVTPRLHLERAKFPRSILADAARRARHSLSAYLDQIRMSDVTEPRLGKNYRGSA